MVLFILYIIMNELFLVIIIFYINIKQEIADNKAQLIEFELVIKKLKKWKRKN